MSAHDYVVCATHRCGSNLLCSLLRGTGVAGLPREHIKRLRPRGWVLAPLRDATLVALLPERPPSWQPPNPDALIEQARRDGAGSDGVCGTKIMWSNLSALAELLDKRPEGVLRLLTRRLRCVHITRSDKVAQAVSYWAAMQTESWWAGQEEQREPIYHFGAIDHLVQFLREQERHWHELFETAGIEAHTVVYEDLVEDPVEIVRGVLRHIGVRDDVAVHPPSMRRQGGRRSAEWIARYLSER